MMRLMWRSEKERERTMRSRRVLTAYNQAILSGLAYCFSSCSMILVNKYVLSSYDFNAGISLMLYQNLVSVVIVSTLNFLGIITTEPLTWRLIKAWLPVNIIFVGMLVTSMFRKRRRIGPKNAQKYTTRLKTRPISRAYSKPCFTFQQHAPDFQMYTTRA